MALSPPRAGRRGGSGIQGLPGLPDVADVINSPSASSPDDDVRLFDQLVDLNRRVRSSPPHRHQRRFGGTSGGNLRRAASQPQPFVAPSTSMLSESSSLPSANITILGPDGLPVMAAMFSPARSCNGDTETLFDRVRRGEMAFATTGRLPSRTDSRRGRVVPPLDFSRLPPSATLALTEGSQGMESLRVPLPDGHHRYHAQMPVRSDLPPSSSLEPRRPSPLNGEGWPAHWQDFHQVLISDIGPSQYTQPSGPLHPRIPPDARSIASDGRMMAGVAEAAAACAIGRVFGDTERFPVPALEQRYTEGMTRTCAGTMPPQRAALNGDGVHSAVVRLPDARVGDSHGRPRTQMTEAAAQTNEVGGAVGWSAFVPALESRLQGTEIRARAGANEGAFATGGFTSGTLPASVPAPGPEFADSTVGRGNGEGAVIASPLGCNASTRPPASVPVPESWCSADAVSAMDDRRIRTDGVLPPNEVVQARGAIPPPPLSVQTGGNTFGPTMPGRMERNMFVGCHATSPSDHQYASSSGAPPLPSHHCPSYGVAFVSRPPASEPSPPPFCAPAPAPRVPVFEPRLPGGPVFEAAPVTFARFGRPPTAVAPPPQVAFPPQHPVCTPQPLGYGYGSLTGVISGGVPPPVLAPHAGAIPLSVPTPSAVGVPPISCCGAPSRLGCGATGGQIPIVSHASVGTSLIGGVPPPTFATSAESAPVGAARVLAAGPVTSLSGCGAHASGGSEPRGPGGLADEPRPFFGLKSAGRMPPPTHPPPPLRALSVSDLSARACPVESPSETSVIAEVDTRRGTSSTACMIGRVAPISDALAEGGAEVPHSSWSPSPAGVPPFECALVPVCGNASVGGVDTYPEVGRNAAGQSGIPANGCVGASSLSPPSPSLDGFIDCLVGPAHDSPVVVGCERGRIRDGLAVVGVVGSPADSCADAGSATSREVLDAVVVPEALDPGGVTMSGHNMDLSAGLLSPRRRALVAVQMSEQGQQTTPEKALVAVESKRRRRFEGLRPPPRVGRISLITCPIDGFRLGHGYDKDRCCRARYPPLDAWKNERVQYERKPKSLLPTIAKLIVAKEKIHPDADLPPPIPMEELDTIERASRFSMASPAPAPMTPEAAGAELSPPRETEERVSGRRGSYGKACSWEGRKSGGLSGLSRKRVKVAAVGSKNVPMKSDKLNAETPAASLEGGGRLAVVDGEDRWTDDSVGTPAKRARRHRHGRQLATTGGDDHSALEWVCGLREGFFFGPEVPGSSHHCQLRLGVDSGAIFCCDLIVPPKSFTRLDRLEANKSIMVHVAGAAPGTLRLTLDGVDTILSQNDFAVVRSGKEYSLRNDSEVHMAQMKMVVSRQTER